MWKYPYKHEAATRAFEEKSQYFLFKNRDKVDINLLYGNWKGNVGKRLGVCTIFPYYGSRLKGKNDTFLVLLSETVFSG